MSVRQYNCCGLWLQKTPWTVSHWKQGALFLAALLRPLLLWMGAVDRVVGA